MDLLLIHHARPERIETEDGSPADPPLDPTGREQAERTAAWLADEKNPVHVKEAVGHSDLRTTMGYTHLAREHLRSLVDREDQKLEQFLA